MFIERAITFKNLTFIFSRPKFFYKCSSHFSIFPMSFSDDFSIPFWRAFFPFCVKNGAQMRSQKEIFCRFFEQVWTSENVCFVYRGTPFSRAGGSQRGAFGAYFCSYFLGGIPRWLLSIFCRFWAPHWLPLGHLFGTFWVPKFGVTFWFNFRRIWGGAGGSGGACGAS